MDDLFGILCMAAPSRVALLAHEGVAKLAKTLCQTPTSLPPTSKWVEKKYYVPTKEFK